MAGLTQMTGKAVHATKKMPRNSWRPAAGPRARVSCKSSGSAQAVAKPTRSEQRYLRSQTLLQRVDCLAAIRNLFSPASVMQNTFRAGQYRRHQDSVDGGVFDDEACESQEEKPAKEEHGSFAQPAAKNHESQSAGGGGEWGRQL
eukprot:875755-Rhodomonas_salina.2